MGKLNLNSTCRTIMSKKTKKLNQEKREHNLWLLQESCDQSRGEHSIRKMAKE